MFLIDDLFMAALPTIMSAAGTAGNAISTTAQWLGNTAISGGKAIGDTAVNAGKGIGELFGFGKDAAGGKSLLENVGNTSQQFMNSPGMQATQFLTKKKSEIDTAEEQARNEFLATIQAQQAQDEQLIAGIPAYAKGGVPNDGKPARIVDLKSGKTTATMNEDGPERIVPFTESVQGAMGLGKNLLVDLPLGVASAPVAMTKPFMGEINPETYGSRYDAATQKIATEEGTVDQPLRKQSFLGLGDYGESMRSLMRLVGYYNDVQNMRRGAGKSSITAWLDWQDAVDTKNAQLDVTARKAENKKTENMKSLFTKATSDTLTANPGIDPNSKSFALKRDALYKQYLGAYKTGGEPTVADDEYVTVSTTKEPDKQIWNPFSWGATPTTTTETIQTEAAQAKQEEMQNEALSYKIANPKATEEDVNKYLEKKFGKVKVYKRK